MSGAVAFGQVRLSCRRSPFENLRTSGATAASSVISFPD